MAPRAEPRTKVYPLTTRPTGQPNKFFFLSPAADRDFFIMYTYK